MHTYEDGIETTSIDLQRNITRLAVIDEYRARHPE
jgi:hypothetical protein